MVKTTFATAALIAAIAFTSQAMAAHKHLVAGHRTAQAHALANDCVRAPKVGAFATDPWTVPPCMPNTAMDAFH